jgi:hypothetical protein
MKAYATIYEGEFGLERWILKAGFWGQIFRMFLIEFAFTFPVSLLFTVLNIRNMDGFLNAPDFSNLPLLVTVVLIVIIVPIFETLIYNKHFNLTLLLSRSLLFPLRGAISAPA